MYIGVRVKHPLFLSDIQKIWICLDIFENPRIKFHENLSSGSRVVPFGYTDRQT